MEHAEALERIEIAAAEPDGLDRLMAGDTVDAAAVAGHLAGCPSCAEELVRIRRTQRGRARGDPRRAGPGAARADAGLRARRRAGPVDRRRRSERPDGGGAGPGRSPCAGRSTITVAAGAGRLLDRRLRGRRPGRGRGCGPARGRGRGRPRRAAWATRSAGRPSSADLEASAAEVAVLSDAATTALRIEAQPDAQRVPLDGDRRRRRRAPAPSRSRRRPASWSPWRPAWSRRPPNEEYGCWVEVDGERRRLGKMYWAGDVWTWAGPVDGLDGAARRRRVRRLAQRRRRHPVRARPDRRALSGSGRRRAPLAAAGIAGSWPAGRRAASPGRARGAVSRPTARDRRTAAPARTSSARPAGSPPASSGATSTSGGGKPRYRRWARSTRSAVSASTGGWPSDRAIHDASAGSSRSPTSRSRRLESATTSQVSAAPATTPTIRSHQLNSALIGGRRETRVDGASRPRIADTTRTRARAVRCARCP